jgi:hypothetical protein
VSRAEILPCDLAQDDHPVDKIEPLPEEVRDERIAELSTALVEILHWMTKRKSPRHIAARALVLANALHVQNNSFADIGRATEISREGVRLMAREIEERFGVRSCNNRGDDTRRKCRKSRLVAKERRES